MPAISAFLGKATLDWMLGGTGGAVSSPAFRYLGLAVGTPNSTGGSEMGTLTGYSRLTVLFGAAASPAGSASNTAALTFGPFSSVGSVLGVNIFDGSPVNSSNQLWYGTLQTARTIGIGDSLVVAPGALTLTIS